MGVPAALADPAKLRYANKLTQRTPETGSPQISGRVADAATRPLLPALPGHAGRRPRPGGGVLGARIRGALAAARRDRRPARARPTHAGGADRRRDRRHRPRWWSAPLLDARGAERPESLHRI